MMKRPYRFTLLPMLLISVMALSGVCIADDASRGPYMRLSEEILDLGRFRANEPQDRSFTIYNDGDEPLSILTIFSGCGCARTSYGKETIQPGDSCIVSVHFNGKGRRAGGFRKAVIIRSNATNTPVRICIDGVILE